MLLWKHCHCIVGLSNMGNLRICVCLFMNYSWTLERFGEIWRIWGEICNYFENFVILSLPEVLFLTAARLVIVKRSFTCFNCVSFGSIERVIRVQFRLWVILAGLPAYVMTESHLNSKTKRYFLSNILLEDVLIFSPCSRGFLYCG